MHVSRSGTAQDDVVASHLRFEILGPLSLSSDGKYIELGPPRQRALLAILLTHVGRVVPLPSIIGAIWGHNPRARSPAHSRPTCPGSGKYSGIMTDPSGSPTISTDTSWTPMPALSMR